jgi:hypothetical protein
VRYGNACVEQQRDGRPASCVPVSPQADASPAPVAAPLIWRCNAAGSPRPLASPTAADEPRSTAALVCLVRRPVSARGLLQHTCQASNCRSHYEQDAPRVQEASAVIADWICPSSSACRLQRSPGSLSGRTRSAWGRRRRRPSPSFMSATVVVRFHISEWVFREGRQQAALAVESAVTPERFL